MGKVACAAVIAAGFAVASTAALPARAADLSPSLQSFSTAKVISAYELSAPGVAGGDVQTSVATVLTGSPLGFSAPSFASSMLLGPNLALDSGRGLDLAGRFTGREQPLSAVTAPYLALANGSRYSGLTFVPSENLRLRAGVAISSDRLDRFSFDAAAPTGPLALTYDASQSNSLLGGISFDPARGLGFDISAIANQRSGVPLGLGNGIAPKASSQALTVTGHMDIGQGWVTTASFSEGMTQLDQRMAPASSNLHEQSFAFAITKHGLFGDDALGLSFSRPAPSLAGTLAGLSATGDLPLIVAQGVSPLRPGVRATENDFQLGYITNFLDGAVALQTNAAYQTNFQGQPGATSVSLLSRAKIKF